MSMYPENTVTEVPHLSSDEDVNKLHMSDYKTLLQSFDEYFIKSGVDVGFLYLNEQENMEDCSELDRFKRMVEDSFIETHKLIFTPQPRIDVFQSNFISNIVSQTSRVNFNTCVQNLIFVKLYARSVEYSSKNIDQLLLLESEVVPYSSIKDLIPVDAIFRYIGTKKRIFVQLYWAIVCICRKRNIAFMDLVNEASSVKQLYELCTSMPYLIYLILSPQTIKAMKVYLQCT